MPLKMSIGLFGPTLMVIGVSTLISTGVPMLEEFCGVTCTQSSAAWTENGTGRTLVVVTCTEPAGLVTWPFDWLKTSAAGETENAGAGFTLLFRYVSMAG